MEPLEPGVVVGDFQVQRLIGEGAEAQVYLAQDLKLGRRVALKLLKAQAQDDAEFLQEARTTARFSHPNIITLYQADVWRGRPYLALEYLEGETLRGWASHGLLAPVEALRLALSIAEALADAHRHGIIHADLKPENVIVVRGGLLKVVDFGLARRVGTAAGAASGTLAYMSPERRSFAQVPSVPSAAMDVWSLGVILFELVEGRRPFPDDALVLSLRGEGVAWPARVRSLPGGDVIAQSLEPQAQRRPTAEALAQGLRLAIDSFAKARAPDAPPFRGLRAFTEEDAGDFTGRDGEADDCVERLHRLRRVLLGGTSGVGKSSFLSAGLAPRLREASAQLERLRPTATPLTRLALALVGKDEAPAFAQVLRAQPQALVEKVLARGPSLVLLIDHLEELFTLALPDEREGFLACLEVLHDSAVCQLVLAIRQDFLGELFTQLDGRFSDSLVTLKPLSRVGLARAVEVPLRRVGFGCDEPLLVERLVDDVVGRPATLPLLQFVCQALWDTRDTTARQLKAAHYQALGGAAGALTAQADRVLRELPVEDLKLARALLLRLVTAEDTRQPRTLGALLDGLESGGPVVELLLAQRLLVSTADSDSAPLIELAHEALITQWPLLRRWLDESREDRAFRDEVEAAAALWSRRGRRSDETWGGATLALALQRREGLTRALTAEAQAFLEEGHRRDRAARRRRALAIGAVIATLAAVAVGGVSAALITRAQQEQIRLAAGNHGTFLLALQPFEWGEDGGVRWVDAAALPQLRWTLGPAPTAWRELAFGKPYAEDLLQVKALGAFDGGQLWEVRSPAAPAVLQVTGRGAPDCGPSVLRLQALPGYEESLRHRSTLTIPVPTCAASLEGMAPVPAGPYLSPRDDDAPVDVDAFSIDVDEATAERYAVFDALTPLTGFERVPIPPVSTVRSPKLPMQGLNAVQADAFCRYLGKRLPTAEEWLKAARGGLMLRPGQPNPFPARLTPWGPDDAGVRYANLEETGGEDSFPMVAPVGAMRHDVSPYGVRDLGGNLSEWSSTVSTSRDTDGLLLLMGAGWGHPEARQGLDMKNTRPALAVHFDIGARCVSATTAGPALPAR